MGKRAQEIGSFFRTFDVAFEKSNISFLFTNKLYTNLGNQYDPWKETGGLNADYNPSISVRFANTALTDDKTETEIKEEKERRKSSLGNSLTTIKANIKKSRFGTAGRNALFLFDFAVGPVKLSGLFTLLKDFGVITGNRTYSIKGWNNDKSFYKKDFLKLLLKDEEANIKIKSRKNNKVLSNAYSSLIANAEAIAKKEQREVLESDLISVAKSTIKKLEKQLDVVVGEIYVAYKEEILILNELLPKQVSDEEVIKAIDELIDKESLSGNRAIGILMKELKTLFGDTFNPATASKLIKERI